MQPAPTIDSATSPASRAATYLHQVIGRLVRARNRIDARLAVALRNMNDSEGYLEFGYSSIVQYAQIEHDLRPSTTMDLVRLAHRLEGLPQLGQAVIDGTVSWTKAREVARVATEQTEQAWVQRATELSSRRLEAEVRVSKPGDEPPDREPWQLAPARTRLTVELEADEAEMVHKALTVMRSETGARDAEVGTLLAAMARMALHLHETTRPEVCSHEAYRVVLMHCPTCSQTWHAGADGDAAVSDAITAKATCDCEWVDATDEPGTRAGQMSRTAPPAMRRTVLAHAHHRCSVPGCRARVFLDVHHIEPWQFGGATVPDNLLPVCPIHHTLVHTGRLSVERCADGRSIWRRTDGTVLDGPEPPPDPSPPPESEADGAAHVGPELPPPVVQEMAKRPEITAIFDRLGQGPAAEGDLIRELSLEPSVVAAALGYMMVAGLTRSDGRGRECRFDDPRIAWRLASGWVAAGERRTGGRRRAAA